MSYKSIFQDVRSAVDWVHLNVSLLLYFTFHCGGLRKKRNKIFCQICYQYFDFHDEVLFEIWMEVKCCQNQTNIVPDLECSSQNIYWHVASCLYICGNVKKKKKKGGKFRVKCQLPSWQKSTFSSFLLGLPPATLLPPLAWATFSSQLLFFRLLSIKNKLHPQTFMWHSSFVVVLFPYILQKNHLVKWLQQSSWIYFKKLCV